MSDSVVPVGLEVPSSSQVMLLLMLWVQGPLVNVMDILQSIVWGSNKRGPDLVVLPFFKMGFPLEGTRD